MMRVKIQPKSCSHEMFPTNIYKTENTSLMFVFAYGHGNNFCLQYLISLMSNSHSVSVCLKLTCVQNTSFSPNKYIYLNKLN